MGRLDLNKKREQIQPYLDAWDKQTDKIKFLCETIAYYNGYDDCDIEEIIDIAKDCQSDYSKEVQKMTDVEIRNLFLN